MGIYPSYCIRYKVASSAYTTFARFPSRRNQRLCLWTTGRSAYLPWNGWSTSRKPVTLSKGLKNLTPPSSSTGPSTHRDMQRRIHHHGDRLLRPALPQAMGPEPGSRSQGPETRRTAPGAGRRSPADGGGITIFDIK